ncbi:hypothetical protein CDV36_013609 [Fusarium kuroshium]|uniref:Uncharacterized protein n=1 Tax=Fusarium kuroshium TaxID=2010991 RepID=A0A3M2RPM1_9HYPO|nr:hypothetical protein CDV36_013609 [Fusarium kuroshium]
MQALKLDHTPYYHHGHLELERLTNFEPPVNHVRSHNYYRNHHIHYREQHFRAHHFYQYRDNHQYRQPAV